jgi:hypothetical protein
MGEYCSECEEKLVNIEYFHSSYETFVCTNKKCPVVGKVQLHRKKDTFEIKPSNVKFTDFVRDWTMKKDED